MRNKIKYYRKKFNISQLELAKKIGVTKQHISKIENDRVNVSVEIALKLTNAFKDITKEKSRKQEVILKVEDLFYL